MSTVIIFLVIHVLLEMLAFGISTPPEIYYVRTTDSPPSDCPHQPCLTLYQYTLTNNFTIGTTLQLLPGNHTLQESILNLTNVSNICLRGAESNSDVNIICTNAVTIKCVNVTSLKIEGLTFLLNFIEHDKTALEFINCHNLLILNTTFQGSEDVLSISRAMFLQNSTATIRNSVFEGNVGGAIYIQDDSNLTLCGSSFTRNKGLGNGGAVYAQESTLLLDGSTPNYFTHNSDVKKGGAIQSNYNCSLEMRGINIFKTNYISVDIHNSVGRGGALFISEESLLLLEGTVLFWNNTASMGGAVHLVDCDIIVDGEVEFIGNTAHKSGGGLTALWTSVTTINNGHMRFIDNRAGHYGAALRIKRNRENRESVLSANFLRNRAEREAAVYITSSRITFVNVNITGNINGALTITIGNITFSGLTRIAENTPSPVFHYIIQVNGGYITFNGTTRIVRNSGGGITARSSVITFEKYTIFDNNNSSHHGGAVHCQECKLSFQGSTLFVNNTVADNGGAIYALGTSIYIQGTVNFTLNTASNGGAIYLDNGASLIFRMNTSLHTSYNTAVKYGGVIYHEDNPSIHQCKKAPGFTLPPCFFQEEPYITSSNTEISSFHNKAGIDGDLLYGGLIDRCVVKTQIFYARANGWFTKRVRSQGSTTKGISSKPYELCICPYAINCISLLSVQVYRGQKFTVPLLAKAQVGTTTTTVTAITSSRAKLEIYQTSQSLPNYCHPLPYTLYSTDSHEELVLYPNGPCKDTGTARVVINVTLLPCPVGFTQSGEFCTCEERLQHYHVNCTIADIPCFTKTADSDFWMGVLYTNTSYEGLVLANSCPAEYCKTDAVNITLDDPDFQCDLNRSGLLCGACATNHSLMLGSSQCQVCPNTYLALLLPFAAAGIVLVVFLSFLRLTVATGTLNSVILYANIVQVNRNLFFPANTRNVLKVFLAWMNLDFGFQTCFYDGMDAYAQTWLQFAFPLYVWLLIALMIVISRYSITLSKLIGHNPIAVLATLLLMSYTKILKIIVEIYSSADLIYPENITIVWLKDANVPYLQSKHLFLTVVTSLVLVFFFFPYTLFLLLGHKLYLFTGRKYWHWLNRLKPLLDSYHAPYKIHTRYWTGFLLLVRCALYIVFLLNSFSTSKSCLAIVLTFTGLLVIMGVIYSGRIYKKHYINILEALIYLNLIVLSATTQNGLNAPGLVYTLVALVLVVMLLISAYQFHILYIAKSALWQRLEREWSRYRDKSDSKSNSETDTAITSQNTHNIVTKTTIELREPLLEN